jgi:hypothetical protein
MEGRKEGNKGRGIMKERQEEETNTLKEGRK